MIASRVDTGLPASGTLTERTVVLDSFALSAVPTRFPSSSHCEPLVGAEIVGWLVPCTRFGPAFGCAAVSVAGGSSDGVEHAAPSATSIMPPNAPRWTTPRADNPMVESLTRARPDSRPPAQIHGAMDARVRHARMTTTLTRPYFACCAAAAIACACCCSICAMARERSIANCFTSRFGDVASLLSRPLIFSMSFDWKSASK